MGRAVGYLVSAIVASLVYIAWFLVDLTRMRPHVTGIAFDLSFSVFFWLTGGYAVTLVILSGEIYFPAVGACFIILIGCAMASISPKPLWIEDQTFLEGALIAAARQGLSFLFSGIAFGASYWFGTERQFSAHGPHAGPRPRCQRRSGVPGDAAPP
jgi:hypothetical protein